MNKEIENGQNKLTDTTRAKLKDVSRAFLRLHKILLDGAKAEYEAAHEVISSANQYLQLVIDDEHFAWLRKISALVALVDEATSLRRPATETDALALLGEAKILLEFEDADVTFNDKLQTALQNNPDAVISFNDAKRHLSDK